MTDPQLSALNNDEPSQFKFMTRMAESNYAPANESVRGAIVSVCCLDLNFSGDALRERIVEILRSLLFGPDIQRYPYVIGELRDLLQRHRSKLLQHHSRKITMTLTHGLYDEADEGAVAIELANALSESQKCEYPPPQHTQVHIEPADATNTSRLRSK